jgi:hypothetical protein
MIDLWTLVPPRLAEQSQLSSRFLGLELLLLVRRLDYGGLTDHGSRSNFRDWGAEQTGCQNELLEMALAHTLSNKTEVAYRRGDLFDKRIRLMNDWAALCAAPAARGEVIPLRGA